MLVGVRYLPYQVYFGIYFSHLQYILQFQQFSRIMVGLNVIVPLFYWSTIVAVAMKSIALNRCLGEEYKIFFLEKWTFDSFFETVWSWSWTVILGILMSNILDFYFIYSCSEEIKKTDDSVKDMISDQAYLKRKR